MIAIGAGTASVDTVLNHNRPSLILVLLDSSISFNFSTTGVSSRFSGMCYGVMVRIPTDPG